MCLNLSNHRSSLWLYFKFGDPVVAGLSVRFRARIRSSKSFCHSFPNSWASTAFNWVFTGFCSVHFLPFANFEGADAADGVLDAGHGVIHHLRVRQSRPNKWLKHEWWGRSSLGRGNGGRTFSWMRSLIVFSRAIALRTWRNLTNGLIVIPFKEIIRWNYKHNDTCEEIDFQFRHRIDPRPTSTHLLWLNIFIQDLLETW